MHSKSVHRLVLVVLFLGMVPIGCNFPPTDDEIDDPDSTDSLDTDTGTGFVSANPGRGNFYGDVDGDSDIDTDSGGDADTDADSDSDDDPEEGEEDPESLIEEADVIQVVGNTLYALSRFRGLAVIDISNPYSLTLLGRLSMHGEPFEMYFRDGFILAMFSSFYDYEYDDESFYYTFRGNSGVVAIDVKDPTSPEIVNRFEVLGTISDSRIVGDILYTVSFENGRCWGCDGTKKTAITSLDVENVHRIKVADRLEYEETNIYQQRSVEVTTERMYVSGPAWNNSNGRHQSTLQVVDISDPTGDLVSGASVDLAGQIESRWQMNEYKGVLRIISQPGWGWNSEIQPVVETFEIVSAQELIPLGSLDMVLPRPEDLMSVRFDGPRGYAVTFERTDPLFVIDLSDPTQPKQLGELEIPGWLYHMEPRGNRLYAIGFDQQEETGLAVSLFDVENPTKPTLLSRVNFGAEWGEMPEDQDRIHKAFKILDDEGLILMPFDGWSRDNEGYQRHYHSGVQLIDFTADTLTLRGVAPHQGRARRAFLHDDYLFAMSDERVEAYDISDRNNPAQLSMVTLSRSVHRTLVVDGVIVELVSDWWTKEARLEIYPIDDPDADVPISVIDLTDLKPSNTRPFYYWHYGFNYDNARLFHHENYVYLMWTEHNEYMYEFGWEDVRDMTTVATFDISHLDQPQFVGKTLFPIALPYEYQGGNFGYYDQTVRTGKTVIQDGSVFAIRGDSFHDDGYYVLDVTDPKQPNLSDRINVAEDHAGHLANGGGVIFTSHAEPERGSNFRVRFYLDRLDISDPSKPRWLPKVNVPGTPVYYSERTGKLVTVDYKRSPLLELVYYINYLSVENHEATLLERHRLDTQRLARAIVTDEVAFVSTHSNRYWYDDDNTPRDPRPRGFAFSMDEEEPLKMLAEWRCPSMDASLRDAKGRTALFYAYSPPRAHVYQINPQGAVTDHDEHLTGKAYDVYLTETHVVSANGQWGVQTFDIPVE